MRITPWFLLDILIMVLMSLGVIILFNLANIYYLRKLQINKWIPLGISIALIIATQFLTVSGQPLVLNIIVFMLGVFFLVWFFDLHRNPKTKTDKYEKKIVMKPKAKPHRAKSLKEKDGENTNKTSSK